MNTPKTDPLLLLKQADLIYDATTVNQAIDLLSDRINQDFSDKQPLLMPVMTGASYLFGQLLPKLAFPLEVGYVHATRYHGDVSGELLEWKVRPERVENRNVLVLDDILDKGYTLRAIVDECMQAGALSVKTVVLADKQLNLEKPIQADYSALNVPDKYVFGCGMDVYGWWRNLPAIYALNTDF